MVWALGFRTACQGLSGLVRGKPLHPHTGYRHFVGWSGLSFQSVTIRVLSIYTLVLDKRILHGNTIHQPWRLTSLGRSVWPYRVTAQYFYWIIPGTEISDLRLDSIGDVMFGGYFVYDLWRCRCVSDWKRECNLLFVHITYSCSSILTHGWHAWISFGIAESHVWLNVHTMTTWWLVPQISQVNGKLNPYYFNKH